MQRRAHLANLPVNISPPNIETPPIRRALRSLDNLLDPSPAVQFSNAPRVYSQKSRLGVRASDSPLKNELRWSVDSEQVDCVGEKEGHGDQDSRQQHRDSRETSSQQQQSVSFHPQAKEQQSSPSSSPSPHQLASSSHPLPARGAPSNKIQQAARRWKSTPSSFEPVSKPHPTPSPVLPPPLPTPSPKVNSTPLPSPKVHHLPRLTTKGLLPTRKLLIPLSASLRTRREGGRGSIAIVSSGEVVIDLRGLSRLEFGGGMIVISGDGETISTFPSPPLPSVASFSKEPLLLLNPEAAYTRETLPSKLEKVYSLADEFVNQMRCRTGERITIYRQEPYSTRETLISDHAVSPGSFKYSITFLSPSPNPSRHSPSFITIKVNPTSSSLTLERKVGRLTRTIDEFRIDGNWENVIGSRVNEVERGFIKYALGRRECLEDVWRASKLAEEVVFSGGELPEPDGEEEVDSPDSHISLHSQRAAETPPATPAAHKSVSPSPRTELPRSPPKIQFKEPSAGNISSLDPEPEEERRCLPGAGWIIRSLHPNSSKYIYDVLFCDGTSLKITGSELCWEGRWYDWNLSQPRQEQRLPPRVKSRLGFVEEMMSLFEKGLETTSEE